MAFLTEHQTEKRTTRTSANLPIALVLLGTGSLLCLRAALRGPGALDMLPWVDGCLTVGIVGVLLALLHGITYPTALLSVAVPLALVQFLVAGLSGFALPVLGIELTALGLLGLPLSRLPRRRPAATAPTHALSAAHPSPS
ncbi:hypothetical protein WME90_10190 [Sorangium sp. So ce375]|uniref:hypothetical protein n=1 Tax=Sorangium sp. So ce375 TaxID=3133306 RepID=UPI003F5CBB3F